jgi:two-component system, cell cycle sensor histidine kinase and response regulator CckA
MSEEDDRAHPRGSVEEDLRRSEARSRLLWDTSPLPKWIFHRDTLAFLDVNPAAEALYGYSRVEFLRMTLAKIRQPEPSPRRLALSSAPVGAVHRGISRHQKKDGSVIEVDVTAVRTTWDGDPVIHATLRDVTEARRAERELRALEARYRAVFDNAPLPKLIFDLDTLTLVDANEAAVRFYGYSRQELLARRLSDLRPASEVPRLLEAVSRVGSSAQCMGVWTHKKKDGSLADIEVSAHGIELDGRTYGVMTGLDVTEQRRLRAELLQSQKIEAVGQLAGGVAHDFNNVLAAILADAEWIGAQLGPGHPLAEAAEQIRTSAHRGAAMARQLLLFARRQPAHVTTLSLNTVIKELGRLLGRLLGEHVDVVQQLDGGLGHVRADATQIEQILLNLTVNARDAMPKGGTLTIATSNVDQDPRVPAGSWVALRVTDVGSGIDDATKARMFEPFFTTKEAGRGTGLGLSTVWTIVEQAGGHVLVDSVVGQGSTFTILLPRVAQVSPSPSAHASLAPAAASGATVLVVEDDDQVRRVVVRSLRAVGYRVLEAAGPGEAMRVAGEGGLKVDVVLTDVVMPGGDGVELAGKLRSLQPGAGVLFMSGYVGLAEGLDASRSFLMKPFTPKQICTAVRDAYDQRPGAAGGLE